MKDTLFILAAPFQDGGFEWYCNDCATLEGALLVNPHWNEKIEVQRIGFPRPRKEIVDLVGADWQGCPMLVMDKERAPGDAIIVGELAILQDVRAIGRALTSRHGGVGPHP
ncbi:MAG: DUF3088 family protein [Hyphomonadaceae bacterium]|jgi:hypothetical protein